MATTSIHAITKTVAQAINYGMGDKIEPLLKDDAADTINYAVNNKTGEVTYFTLNATSYCGNPRNPVEDFCAMMETFGENEIKNGNPRSKNGVPILAWHLIQSFEGQVDPQIANRIGVTLAEEIFGERPAVISTHTNTDNTHNHIIACAWDWNGKKFNNNHAAYDKIRYCSDSLCEEYGLPVLESTRKRNLVKWIDSEGKLHYYEPTDRKNELIKRRKNGELTTDDVNSYRNTMSYEVSEVRRGTNAETVKQAIDNVFPYAISYEHLLSMMREMGFKVKDKKKNGEWLSHITFIPPTADKGVRDNSIDKGSNYYSRENLTAIINERNAKRKENEALQAELKLTYFEKYVYGGINIPNLNEDYRADIADDGGIEIVRRGKAESTIIRDVKRLDLECKKDNCISKNREGDLVMQNQERFACLRFIERKKIYSSSQAEKIVKGLQTQYDACILQIEKGEAVIDQIEMAINAPQIIAEAQKRVELGKDDAEYMMEKYSEDIKLIKTSKALKKKYNINDTRQREELQDQCRKYRGRIADLQATLREVAKSIDDYKLCIDTLRKIELGERQEKFQNGKPDLENMSDQNSRNRKKERER